MPSDESSTALENPPTETEVFRPTENEYTFDEVLHTTIRQIIVQKESEIKGWGTSIVRFKDDPATVERASDRLTVTIDQLDSAIWGLIETIKERQGGHNIKMTEVGGEHVFDIQSIGSEYKEKQAKKHDKQFPEETNNENNTPNKAA